MAKWDVRVKRKLKIGLQELKQGVYIPAELFDDFIPWLQTKGFKEPEGGDLKGNAFVSPDSQWLIYFRRMPDGFVFIQLRGFFRVRLGL